ncbi:MAG: GNAT family N-acetyltransferase, partial [Paraglaciecola sp.]|nr:GNAT family N-acetyltransferase [Paraglaciecola sp.]
MPEINTSKSISIDLIPVAHDEIDLAADRYVLKHAQGSVYHLAAWRNAITQAYRQQCILLLAKQQNEIVGLLPLCIMSVPLRGNKLISLPFADFCSVLADSTLIREQLLQAAIALLPSYKASQLDLRESVALPNLQEPPSNTDTAGPNKVRMLVQLAESAEVLLASYKPKLRSQIKKAQKNGLTAEISDSTSALKDFYQVYSKNMHRLGSPVHNFQWFSCLTQQLAAKQAFKVVLVRSDKQVIGAGLVLHCGKQAVIPWASTVAEFNHLAPNMLLYWQIQAYLADAGFSVFDMGRSTIGEGTYRFKTQWGAQPEELCWHAYNAQSEAIPLSGVPSGKTRAVAEKIWRLLP